ncbi:MAG: 4'-phosphopantetheinyl transferase superfamily protein [Pseudomonadota bacterium]
MTAVVSSLLADVHRLMPAGAEVAARDPALRYDVTLAEAALIQNAVDKRQREFSAGRDAARACLMALGVRGAEIRASQNRAPIWPQGTTGSITHCDGLCLAAVARTDKIAALGLDAEPNAPLPPDMLPIVLREDETKAFANRGRLIFSAKEAVYKCLSPFLDRILEFHDLQLRLGAEGALTARLMASSGRLNAGHKMQVHYVERPDHIITACWMKAGELPC